MYLQFFVSKYFDNKVIYTKPHLNNEFITNFSNKGYKPNIFK